MKLIKTIAELQTLIDCGSRKAFVPTMGNLHAGHLQLIEVAKESMASTGGLTIASIFVNRLQFAPHEDFDQYPRTLQRDCELLESHGCDVVFAPEESTLYPTPQTFKVIPPSDLADLWEGHFRPGFFTGVCTVVAKLFSMIRPDVAVFGKKDYQQLKVIEHMVKQLNMPIQIIGVATKRNAHGLALSSRNNYLSEAQITQALELQEQLKTVKQHVLQSSLSFEAITTQASQTLIEKGWLVDYITLVKQSDLTLAHRGQDQELVCLAAAKLGITRLIDNLEISLTSFAQKT
jgi:pantoate--beta-alanine ligase